MAKQPLVSIIMPVFNTEKFVLEAIESVLAQTYQNWELIIVNDGSTDGSEIIITNFKDSRIKYFKQVNKGVSAARNLGLSKMKGDFFCFLDSDDVFSKRSIESRMFIMLKEPAISFVDGQVVFFEGKVANIIKRYFPKYIGQPYNRLLALDSRCFFGNTWLIRKDNAQHYEFDEDLKYCEDLLFTISVSKNKLYTYTEEIILYYRQSSLTAMKNYRALEKGYLSFFKKVNMQEKLPIFSRFFLQIKIMKIMFLVFFFDARKPHLAFTSILKILKA